MLSRTSNYVDPATHRLDKALYVWAPSPCNTSTTLLLAVVVPPYNARHRTSYTVDQLMGLAKSPRPDREEWGPPHMVVSPRPPSALASCWGLARSHGARQT
jgi:hypothetical protein